jgi:O-antigen/teichoic acid export membrane protein
MQFKKAIQHTILWKVLNTLITFLINILLVRLLGVEQSGLFYYAIALLSLLVLLQSYSLEAGIVYYGSKYGSVSGISSFILPWLLFQSLISILVLYYVAPANINREVAILYTVSNLAIVYCNGLYKAQKKFSTVNFILGGVNFLLLLVLGTMYFFNTPFTTSMHISILHPAAFFYCCSFILQAVLLITVFFFSNKSHTSAIDKKMLKKIFTFSSISFAGNLLFFLVVRIDYFFVEKYCTGIAFSNYIQVSKLGQLMVLLPSVVAAVLFPYAAGAQQQESYLGKTQLFCRVITGCFIFFTLFIVVTGYWLFPLLFGSGFTAMYTALLLYLPGFFSLCIVTVLAAYLAGLELIKINLAASAVALIVVITGDIVLIPYFGINGAAVASSIAYFVCMVYLLWYTKKKMQYTLYDFFILQTADIKMITDLLKQKKENEH